jgi:protein-ribulosamine 3-kinase
VSATTTIPPDVARGVAAALGGRDAPKPFARVDPQGGGCIHPAVRIRTRSGDDVFLKWARAAGWHGFDVEARGLRALADRGGPRIPRVLAFHRGEPAERGWLLLEYIESGAPARDTPERLGRALAHLHAPFADEEPGWEEDGFIGSLPQTNRSAHSRWAAFWKEARLEAQWRSAERYFDAKARRAWERLLGLVVVALEEVADEGLSLLHGDLWSGNVLYDLDGDPVLVDPAVYRGHREVDLAMMELFGGFDPAFMSRYAEEVPLRPGYTEVRRDLYQLYPLLVHVNLFGRGYVSGVTRRIFSLLAELG